MRFLVTDECGRLARWLRLMGYDAAMEPAAPLSGLYRRAYREGRVVVTRNRKVQASCLFRVVHLESQLLEEQLRQLLRDRLLTMDAARAFNRCDICNVEVERAEKSQVKSLVPPYVFQTRQEFHQCPSCHRVYWAATHYARASKFLKSLA